MSQILLTTLNARYIHSSFGLRYLYANLHEFQKNTTIIEYVKKNDINDIVKDILSHEPKIVGIGVYIWNASETSRLIAAIKSKSPNTIIVLGGPEVSHSPLRVNFDLSDYIIQGEGDLEFYKLVKSILEKSKLPNRIIQAEIPKLSDIKLPYEYYNEEDIKNRVIYVEASRGCPFSCQFCLSSIDKMVRNFEIEIFLTEMDKLWLRGARHFKFVDRTFNLNIKITNQILDFFLEKDGEYFLHFEVIPDHFPDSLKEKLKFFPKGSIQLEIGIQTLNPTVANRIQRKLNFEKIKENVTFLSRETNSHLHLDLIIGLPGETVNSFGDNLNTLVSLTDSEIQLGLLKKLSGTSINRHDIEFGMIYSNEPPYEILENDIIPLTEMQKLKRLARYWDLFYNSGNFKRSINLLWSDDANVFETFYQFSNWLFSQLNTTWKIHLNKLAELLFSYLSEIKKVNKVNAAKQIITDISVVPDRRIPKFLKNSAPGFKANSVANVDKKIKRQIKHF
ncbi:MAG: DUF4080 domain-containing protein [Bacteroidota bacterium]